MFHRYFTTKQKRQLTKGFSLVELLVVVGIFIVITSVVLFNQTRFSSNIVVTNLAYEVALAVRQAQTYGISVKDAGGSSGFSYGYGIHFGADSHLADQTKGFTLFNDSDLTINPSTGNDGLFQATEYKDTYRLPGGNKILDFQYCNINTPVKVMAATVGSYLDISFVRPRPNAHIRISGYVSELATPVFIDVQSTLGDKVKRVIIYENGQISVDTNSYTANQTITCP